MPLVGIVNATDGSLIAAYKLNSNGEGSVGTPSMQIVSNSGGSIFSAVQLDLNDPVIFRIDPPYVTRKGTMCPANMAWAVSYNYG